MMLSAEVVGPARVVLAGLRRQEPECLTCGYPAFRSGGHASFCWVANPSAPRVGDRFRWRHSGNSLAVDTLTGIDEDLGHHRPVFDERPL